MLIISKSDEGLGGWIILAVSVGLNKNLFKKTLVWTILKIKSKMLYKIKLNWEHIF